MPELPEVEVIRQGISPYILNQKIAGADIRHQRLRFPVTPGIKEEVIGQPVIEVLRRGKYLLLVTPQGTLIWHLGMSGSLRILKEQALPKKHDHVDLIFANGCCLRFNDPRRFGLLMWTREQALTHPLLAKLGPEPLSPEFTGAYLWEQGQKRTLAIKVFLMTNTIVVGVGNIYAAEALFKARIHPLTPACKLKREQFNRLCRVIKVLLRKAIKQGGTTLKDFVKSDGKPGYFKQDLQVYGRSGEPCRVCKGSLKQVRLGQRATVFCERCQKK